MLSDGGRIHVLLGEGHYDTPYSPRLTHAVSHLLAAKVDESPCLVTVHGSTMIQECDGDPTGRGIWGLTLFIIIARGRTRSVDWKISLANIIVDRTPRLLAMFLHSLFPGPTWGEERRNSNISMRKGGGGGGQLRT